MENWIFLYCKFCAGKVAVYNFAKNEKKKKENRGEGLYIAVNIVRLFWKLESSCIGSGLFPKFGNDLQCWWGVSSCAVQNLAECVGWFRTTTMKKLSPHQSSPSDITSHISNPNMHFPLTCTLNITLLVTFIKDARFSTVTYFWLTSNFISLVLVWTDILYYLYPIFCEFCLY